MKGLLKIIKDKRSSNIDYNGNYYYIHDTQADRTTNVWKSKESGEIKIIRGGAGDTHFYLDLSELSGPVEYEFDVTSFSGGLILPKRINGKFETLGAYFPHNFRIRAGLEGQFSSIDGDPRMYKAEMTEYRSYRLTNI